MASSSTAFRIRGVLLAGLLVGLLGARLARAQPQIGTWEGPTFQLQPYVMTVNSGNVSDLKFKIVSNNTRIFDLVGPYAITSSQIDTGVITGDSCPTVRVTGTFGSSTAFTGTIYIEYVYNAQTCPNPGTGGVDILTTTPGIRGDANDDGKIELNDVFYLINALFAGGPPPAVTKLGDANKDNTVDVNDVFFLINYLFAAGTPPV